MSIGYGKLFFIRLFALLISALLRSGVPLRIALFPSSITLFLGELAIAYYLPTCGAIAVGGGVVRAMAATSVLTRTRGAYPVRCGWLTTYGAYGI